MNRDRDERLRRVFGPSPRDTTQPAAQPRRRFPLTPPIGGLLIAGLILATAFAVAAVAYVATPREHVAKDCLWWTARTVDQVVPGDRGCVRGYIAVGGSLAESRDHSAYRVSFLLSEPDVPVDKTACPVGPGDDVAIRYHA